MIAGRRPPSQPASCPHRHDSLAGYWADIFDRTLDDEDRTRRLHSFTAPLYPLLAVVVLVVLVGLIGVVLVGATALVVGLTSPTTPAWTSISGGAVATAAVVALHRIIAKIRPRQARSGAEARHDSLTSLAPTSPTPTGWQAPDQ